MVVHFDNGVTFEVLLVFENREGTSWTDPNANGDGSWVVCNPRAEISAVEARNQTKKRI